MRRRHPHQFPPLAAAGIFGAAFSLTHTRLCDPRYEGSLMELLDPLMAMIVLSYRAIEAAGRELGRGALVPVPSKGVNAWRLTSRGEEIVQAGLVKGQIA